MYFSRINNSLTPISFGLAKPLLTINPEEITIDAATRLNQAGLEIPVSGNALKKKEKLPVNTPSTTNGSNTSSN